VKKKRAIETNSGRECSLRGEKKRRGLRHTGRVANRRAERPDENAPRPADKRVEKKQRNRRKTKKERGSRWRRDQGKAVSTIIERGRNNSGYSFSRQDKGEARLKSKREKRPKNTQKGSLGNLKKRKGPWLNPSEEGRYRGGSVSFTSTAGTT